MMKLLLIFNYGYNLSHHAMVAINGVLLVIFGSVYEGIM